MNMSILQTYGTAWAEVANALGLDLEGLEEVAHELGLDFRQVDPEEVGYEELEEAAQELSEGPQNEEEQNDFAQWCLETGRLPIPKSSWSDRQELN